MIIMSLNVPYESISAFDIFSDNIENKKNLNEKLFRVYFLRPVQFFTNILEKW